MCIRDRSNTAFSYPERLTIFGVSGTFAETYANENNIKFINKPVSANSIIFDESLITLYKGKSLTLNATITPIDFTDEIVWKSTDNNVVTVDNIGKITAKNVGDATIKVTVGNVSATCKVKVIQPVTSISLNKTSLVLDALETYQLIADVYKRQTYYYTGKNISKTISFITRTYLLATIAVTIYAFIFEFGKYRPNQRFGELLFNESYGTYIFYSYHLLICDCILLYKLVLQHKEMNKNERLFTLLFISILLIATFANGTRKLFAGIFIYTAFLYFIEYRKQLKKLIKYTTYLLILSIIGLLITFNVSSLYQTIGRRIESLFSYVQKEDIDISTYKRNQMMNLGWNLFTQHPILGIGANCYIEMNELYNNMQLYSHNNYLEIGVNQGILSLLVYYIWYFLVMYKLIVRCV